MSENAENPTGDTEGVEDRDIVLATVTITKTLTDEGERIVVYARDPMGDLPTIIDILGMIKWAGDAAYHLDPDHECSMCPMFKDVE